MKLPAPIPLPPVLCQFISVPHSVGANLLSGALDREAVGRDCRTLKRRERRVPVGPGFLFDRGWGRSRNVAACRR